MQEMLIKFATIGVPILVVILIILSTWKKAPQDKAIVVTGLKRRVISGKGGLVVPFLNRQIEYL